MSIESSTSSVDYDTGTAGATTFVIPFRYLDNDHIKVYVGATTGTLVLQTEGSEYALTGTAPAEASANSVEFTGAPSDNYVVRISRVVPLTQPLDLTAQGTYAPSSIENALDRLEMQIQQINDGTISVDSYVAGAPVGSATPVAVSAAAAVVGVSTSSSRQDHAHAVTVAAPVENLMDVANAAGAATSLARSNHTHLITTYSSTPAAIGTASAGTSGTAPARGNHVHAHGNQAAGDLMHASATTTVSGFMDSDDKVKLVGVEWTYDTQLTTTDATVTTAATIPVTTDYIAIIEVEAFAIDGGGTIGVGHKCAGLFKNAAGTVSQYGTTGTMLNLFGSTTAGAFTLSGANVLYQVTGVAATTIKWRVRARIVERSY